MLVPNGTVVLFCMDFGYRIVSIDGTWIIRGKMVEPVEFVTKLDLSMDENVMILVMNVARIAIRSLC